MSFSANLGFLWAELPLPDAIIAAKTAGFDAVECHWPYDTAPEDVKAALEDAGLRMLGLNTSRGAVEAGEMGLSALPDRVEAARYAIDQAIAYASGINARSVHVMSGFAQGQVADRTFRDNLAYACEQAAPHGITILIEPLNQQDAPGYHLQTTHKAREIIDTVAAPNLKLMFDCYHLQIMQGDLTRLLTDCLPIIGHIQFASVPDRGAPDRGALNYPHIFHHIRKLGWTTPLGAEYKTNGPTEPTLGWLYDPAYRG